MRDEAQELLIHPINPDSIAHNQRVIGNIRSLTSSVAGICAGALGLESYAGFAFYLASSLFVSVLIYLGPAQRTPGRFFYRHFSDLWTGDLLGGLMGYVLTWTLLYNLVGA